MVDRSGGAPGKSARSFPWVNVAAACLILIAIALFQLLHRADQSNLAGHADEAAHFVTGVCVLDYFKTALGSDPVSFAESYYVRYPKVAFGHWPPMFYVVQALWYGILGATTLNAILLAGFVTAMAALILFLRIKRLNGTWIAVLSITVLLWLPLVRDSTLLLMSDMTASLFTLLAVLAICDAWATGARRFWIQSVVWTVIAVLTKQSALSLLAFAPVALMIPTDGRRFAAKRPWLIWTGFCLLVALIVALYAATGVLHLRAIPQPVTLPRLWGHLFLLKPFLRGASVAMFLTAAYGILDILVLKRVPASSENGIHAKAALVWLAATLASQVFFREGVEYRYFLPAYFPLIMLFAQGLRSIAAEIDRRPANPVLARVVAAALTGLCILSTPAGSVHQRTGYAEVAASIPSDRVAPAILISSDARGEGGMIVERLVRDKTRGGLVLRASKMLASSDWAGRNYRPLVKSVQDVREFLNTTPVHFIVLDMNGFIEGATRTHHRLLEETIRTGTGQFRLIGDFPLYFDGQRRNSAVQVYENTMARERRTGVIRIDMTNTLGRKLEVRLNAHDGAQDAVAPERPASPGRVPRWIFDLLPVYAPASTSFRIAPKSDDIGAGGGWGRIYVTAQSSYSWCATGAPDWIRMISGYKGSGDGVLAYKVAENISNKHRTAVITIGDAAFQVSQPRSSYTYVPFLENFASLPARWYTSAPDELSSVDPPSRWVLEDQPGRQSRVSVTADAPDGSSSLAIERGMLTTRPGRHGLTFPESRSKRTRRTGFRYGSRRRSLRWCG